jgi:hypothetical protein
VIERIDATGESARPTADLPANRVVFWRLRGRVGAVTGARTSPTWQFRTGVLSPAVDTAHGVEADFNGDGFSDVAVGDVNANSGAGVVSVYYGSATGLSATAARVLMGGSAGEKFGESVASVGDVNGDGFADFAVAVPGRDVMGRRQAGVIQLFWGSEMGIGDRPSQTIVAPDPGNSFGARVVGLGDVTADGYADMAVGFVAGVVPVLTRQVLVFSGSPTGFAAPIQSFEGRVTPGEFDVGIAAGGDMNGDGRAELVLCGLIDSSVRIFRGTATGFADSASVTIPNTSRTAIGAGDVNGDGYADVLVAANGTANLYWGSASGPTAVLQQTVGNSSVMMLGDSAAMGGDFDGDGFSDALLPIEAMTPPHQRVALYRGSVSGLRSMPTATLTPATIPNVMRMRGDFNGDGLTDVLLSAPPSGGPVSGASIWYGSAGTIGSASVIAEARSATP